MLTSTELQFVQNHLDDDLHRLLLSARQYPDIRMPLVAAQIKALLKVRTKIPTWFRFDLNFPPALSVEQASSEHTARFKAGLFSGKLMADLSGGMGVDTSFFAQSFDQVYYVERQPELVSCAQHNFDVLGSTNIISIAAEAEDFLAKTEEYFDLIYLDPARRDLHSRRVMRLEECQPNVLKIKEKLLEKANKALLKTAPMLDLQLAVAQLGCVQKIWVVSVGNECKEVLYLLQNPGLPFDEIPIEAVLLGKRGRSFRFTSAAEQTAAPQYAAPDQYLYEPDAAVLKAGAFKAFAVHYGLSKLHPHTHLYTSLAYKPEVPGRVFRIENVLKYDRKAVQSVIPEGRAQVATRNFPDSVAQMRKKLGLKDGGEWYVFGVTDPVDRKIILTCRRILDNTPEEPTSLLV